MQTPKFEKRFPSIIRFSDRKVAGYRLPGLSLKELTAVVRMAPRSAALFVPVTADPSDSASLAEVVRKLRTKARIVVLEIDDAATITKLADLPAVVDHLRSLGFRLCVGGLSTSPAALAEITRIAPDFVKVGPNSVRTLLRLGSGAKMQVICDGPATLSQRMALVTNGCDLFGTVQAA
jgi:EAL domain-containing protein (putative c-di-GMP-specific phosphodiesterase class I)